MDELNGLLLVDKPSGWTSHDVVAKVRGILKQAAGQKVKVGHSGTLDPMATGLLILLVGSYTKRSEEFMKLDKVYDTEITLGFSSTTDDAEGKLTEVNTDFEYSVKELDEALIAHTGDIEQVPPQYSAIKVDGKRAYKSARSGEVVELKPRKVNVRIINVEFNLPVIFFEAHVTSGTYIRSLARDIGQKLGCGAYLSRLRRTNVGSYSVADAHTIESLNKNSIQKSLFTP